MVGGDVIETIVCEDSGKVWINCTGRTGEAGQQCAIYVEDTFAARCVEEGDGIWWQGSCAFWTPHRSKGNHVLDDYKLKRIGFSGVPHPLRAFNYPLNGAIP